MVYVAGGSLLPKREVTWADSQTDGGGTACYALWEAEGSHIEFRGALYVADLNRNVIDRSCGKAGLRGRDRSARHRQHGQALNQFPAGERAALVTSQKAGNDVFHVRLLVLKLVLIGHVDIPVLWFVSTNKRWYQERAGAGRSGVAVATFSCCKADSEKRRASESR